MNLIFKIYTNLIYVLDAIFLLKGWAIYIAFI